MAGTFGRKGLQPGQSVAAQPGQAVAAQPGQAMAARPSPRPVARPIDAADNEMARRREAFIASERARRVEEPSDYREPTPDLAQLQGYRSPPAERSLGVAYLLWFFACGISAHRFYLGENRSAATQVTTHLTGLALLWIASSMHFLPIMLVALVQLTAVWLWMFADAFLLPSLHRRHRTPRQVDARAVFG